MFCMWDICPLNEPATCQLELPYLLSLLLHTLPHQYHVLESTAFTSELFTLLLIKFFLLMWIYTWFQQCSDCFDWITFTHPASVYVNDTCRCLVDNIPIHEVVHTQAMGLLPLVFCYHSMFKIGTQQTIWPTFLALL